MSSRRQFLAHASAAAALAATHKLSAITKLPSAQIPAPPTVKASLAVGNHLGLTIPRNFIGFSYETQQLTDPSFFTPANSQLVDLFRQLSPHGVLRLGGNTSEFSWWRPTSDSVMPPRQAHAQAAASTLPGEPTHDLAYPITPAAIVNLNQFLRATGWSCIYGLNLGNAVPALAADEAAFVAQSLGPRLEYFQIGNEPNLYSRHLRDPKTWNAKLWYAEWLTVARAVQSRVPNARFAATDTSYSKAWTDAFVELYAATPNPPPLAALSQHYYIGGPPKNPAITINRILADDDAAATGMVAAAAPLRVPVRMAEGNTCYSGGKPGVSDVFAASLWSASYLLHLASKGYSGVNLHGGDGKAVADSLGGTLPGELLMADPHAPHPRPFYTPIDHRDGQYLAQPVFYGMAFAQELAGATLLDSTLTADYTPVGSSAPAHANASAYVARRPDGRTVAAIINRDTINDLLVHITGMSTSSVLRLSAPAPDSSDVSLGGAHFLAQRPFKPHLESAITLAGHSLPIRVPKASAALIFSR